MRIAVALICVGLLNPAMAEGDPETRYLFESKDWPGKTEEQVVRAWGEPGEVAVHKGKRVLTYRMAWRNRSLTDEESGKSVRVYTYQSDPAGPPAVVPGSFSEGQASGFRGTGGLDTGLVRVKFWFDEEGLVRKCKPKRVKAPDLQADP